ncbi:hypothetical protein F2Z80_15435 [Vibrio fortis]|uniref:Uncharacterized protein n=2 Tax=Vibrionaceae TaxID=641 RepID=A0A5N3R2Z4_9VIBR|nr:hypothetical protein F2P58_10590 [Vibrio fortis]KAB0289131.1 hypothetical protein F2P58_08565 [Vibrio fortis]KAB0300539.1 hypothetical protein F2Z80_15435 [Vibrio fortis]
MMATKKNKANAKDSQLIIRINSELKDNFISLCDDMDTSAAREIRQFIKRFVAEHESENEKPQ